MPNPSSEPRLSPTKLANHLSCAHLTQLDLRRARGDLKIEFIRDARLEAMIERGRQFEADYVQQLRAEGRQVVTLDASSTVDYTLSRMQSGAEVIVQAPLSNEQFHGFADVLLRAKAPSKLGAWSYEVLDTKLARQTKAGTILQLLTYGEMIAGMQGLTPEHFYVQTPLGRESYRTADFGAYHRLVLARLQAAVMADPPPVTYPEPVPHCDVCKYWQHCAQQRRRDDHLSLVANLGRSHQRELAQQQISTLTTLAECRGELPAEPARGSRETFRKLGHQAALQVAARTTRPIPFDFLEAESGCGLARLPEPSPGDLFLDFEGDPFVGDGGREYLTGWTDIDGGYTEEWAFTDGEERRATEAFLDAVKARLLQYPDLHIYHFAAYEPAALKRLVTRHGTRARFLDELLRSRRFVDLRTVVREGLRIGIESYGLKPLEELFGYRRELPLQDAARARVQLEIALELHDAAAVPKVVKDAVAVYNCDDCRATKALRDWLENLRESRLAEGADLPRPQAKSGEATDKVSAREDRIATVADKLKEGLPDDRLTWTPDQSSRGLLGDLVGYFQREDKCAFWEHYNLRELPVEDREGNREMLTGLQFVGVAAKQGKERSERHVYTFPMQDTAIEDEEVYPVASEDPNEGFGKALGKVVGMDLARGEVTIKQSPAAAGLHPTAIFRRQHIDTTSLEDSLLAFGEHVGEHGLEDRTAWGPALDLLTRSSPRLRHPSGGPLLGPFEDAVAALTRRCLDLDGSVLPLQGPPGTGKSYSGARAILDLVAAGKKVGITAVSHKVIDNLLGKIHEESRDHGSTPVLLHKHKGDAPAGITYVDAKKALAGLDDGAIVGGTAWLWATDSADGVLDYLFVDEAGQMSLAMVLAASRSARNLVLLGDPMQLEQPSRGAHPEGADRAALKHLLDEDQKTLRDDQGLFLGVTWRMHPAITAFTSELYYEGRLGAQDGCEQQRLDGTEGFDGAGLWLCPVDHEGNQSKADEEVVAVAAVCRRVLRPGATWTNRRGEVQPLTVRDVLVVAPYNAQVAALARSLGKLGVTRVGTVDRFQGQEAAVVVYSCTSSSVEDAPRGMGFLYDPHRFNVATSRARVCVVVVASPKLMEPECRSPEQMRMANGMCRFGEMGGRVALG
jgi:predicted RecB family nuclease